MPASPAWCSCTASPRPAGLGAARRRPGRRPRGRRWSTPPATAARRPVRAGLARRRPGPSPTPAARASTSATRWAPASCCTRRWPAPTSVAGARAARRQPRHRRPRRAGRPPARPTRRWRAASSATASAPSSTSGWPSRCSRRCPRAAADVDDRRRNTAAGLASSLRLAGTGAEPACGTDVGRLDHAGAGAGRAATTPSSPPSASAWPPAIGANATLRASCRAPATPPTSSSPRRSCGSSGPGWRDRPLGRSARREPEPERRTATPNTSWARPVPTSTGMSSRPWRPAEHASDRLDRQRHGQQAGDGAPAPRGAAHAGDEGAAR